MQNPETEKRLTASIYALILIPLGILVKEYNGPGEHIIADKLAGTLYVIFWCLIAFTIFHRVNVKILITSVFVITCSLEFLQQLASPLLDAIRTNYIGRALIGNSFSWSDFIFYLIGAIVSYFALLYIEIKKKSKK